MAQGASTQRLTNLQAPRTRLIGREADLEAVRDRVLHAHGRQVTLVGAGGTGKTTLAFEAARSLPSDFDDGVWLVELALLADPTLVPQAVAAVFGVREGTGCNRSSDKNKEQSSLDPVRRQVLLSHIVLALSSAAVNDRDLVCFGEAAYTAAEATREIELG